MNINAQPYINSLNIPRQIMLLIHQANWDLYHGAPNEEDYPGFSTATSEISDALTEVSDVYIDEDSDDFTTNEHEANAMIYPVYIAREEVLKEIAGTELMRHL